MVALAAIVLNSEVPIEPPSCCPVFTLAEATPASAGATPNVPVLIDGAMTKPREDPSTSSGGSIGRIAGVRADPGQPGHAHGGQQHPQGD